jgi:hypothetical protein
MDHRTVHDLDLELQRIKSDLRRIEQEGGDVGERIPGAGRKAGVPNKILYRHI